MRHILSYSTSTSQLYARFWSTQSLYGIILLPRPRLIILKLSKNVRSVSFSHSQAICHILQHYMWQIYPLSLTAGNNFHVNFSHLYSIPPPVSTPYFPPPRDPIYSLVFEPQANFFARLHTRTKKYQPFQSPVQVPNLKFQTFSDRSYTHCSDSFSPLSFPRLFVNILIQFLTL